MNNDRTEIKYVLVSGIILLFFIGVTVTYAASPFGRHGWMTMISNVVGDDATCGPGEVRQEVLIRDVVTDLPVALGTSDAVLFVVLDQTTYTVLASTTSAGPTTGSLCWNPDTDYLGFDIDGGFAYYDFFAAIVPEDPSEIPRQKHMQSTIWLSGTGGSPPQSYYPMSPVNVAINTVPDYTFQLNTFPSYYGATGASEAKVFVYEVLNGDLSDNQVMKKTQLIAGGVGAKTVTGENFSDGVYSWASYTRLNGSHIADPGFEVLQTPQSGLMWFDTPFILDRVAPTFITNEHSPADPFVGESIRFVAGTEDLLSGMHEIRIYLNGALVRTCPFSGAQTGACAYVSGSLAEGNHSYYFVARDRAGNVETTSVVNFSVTSGTRGPTDLSSASCPDPQLTVLDGDSRMWFSNLFLWSLATPQAMKVVGTLAYIGASSANMGAVPYASRAEGMYIYDISDPTNLTLLSVFQTAHPATVRLNDWGNDVLGIDVEGNYAYLVTYQGGLVIVNIANPSSPTYVGKIYLRDVHTHNRETWGVDVRGNYAYVAGGKGMVVVDVSDPVNPTIASSVDVNANMSHGIQVAGDYAYVALERDGFMIVDISDPTDATLVTQFNDYYTGGVWAYSLEVIGNYLYIAAHFSETFRIYDVSNPQHPVFVRSVSTPSESSTVAPRELYVQGGYLYVGAGEGGVYVFDVSALDNPTLVYHIHPPRTIPLGRDDFWDVIPIDPPYRLIMVREGIHGVLTTDITSCSGALLPDLSVTNSTPPDGQLFDNPGSVEFQGIVNNVHATTITGVDFWADVEIEWDQPNCAMSTGADVTKTAGGPWSNVPDGWSESASASFDASELRNGDHCYRMVVDRDNFIPESDDANNFTPWTAFTVINIPATTPTLIFTADDTSLPANGATTLRWTSTDATSCIASRIPADGTWSGSKGAVSGQDYFESTGTLTSGTYDYTLTCSNDLGDSDDDTVTITVALPVVDGACNTTNATTHSAAQATWPVATFCTTGTANPANPTFPLPGGSVAWLCEVSGGGTDRPCVASRSGPLMPQ